jgi:hypothetical protein
MIALEPTDRPALKSLIGAMECRLSRRQRVEIVRMGRRAKAAKQLWLRRLTSEAAAEAGREGASE